MIAELRTAAECRARADDCRAVADRMDNEQRRQEMLKIADMWEGLARDSEFLNEI